MNDKNLWKFEKQAAERGFLRIAGTDEVGRGPLAGPVVAAAVILPTSFDLDVDDSKKISHAKRCKLYDEIYSKAVSVGIGIVDPIEIDRINILKASLLAMYIAVSNLMPSPDCLLIDGPFKIPFFTSHKSDIFQNQADIFQNPIVRGDSLSVSIASASIIAKVTRDRLMEKYHSEYPQFNFINNKGYPTKAHKEAIIEFGVTPIHRRSFKGVK